MGPLAGVKIVELAGIGPGPMCAMLLADLGATVIRIERMEPSGLGVPRPLQFNFLLRGRQAIALDLKKPESIELVLRLVEQSDALIEGFRPGVTERLGLGPEDCLKRNAKIVYGRMTGWGQTGPLAKSVGHDINYIALTGALNAFGQKDGPPTIPLNIVGDYAGGSLYLALGMLSAIIDARQSGKGQVVDAAIVDGVASLLTSLHGLRAAGAYDLARGSNILDSGAHFYDVYECSDGKWISLGPIEAKFYAALLKYLEIDPASMPPQMDRSNWAQSHIVIAKIIKQRSRQEWCERLEGTDVCFAPVLDLDEAPEHHHMRERGTYVEIGGIVQPGPAPRFSRTVPDLPTPPSAPVEGAEVDKVLAPWFDAATMHALRGKGLLG